jgi:hypothetical protein
MSSTPLYKPLAVALIYYFILIWDTGIWLRLVIHPQNRVSTEKKNHPIAFLSLLIRECALISLWMESCSLQI